jgi:DNA-binding LytR/AlgR family response regulator
MNVIIAEDEKLAAERLEQLILDYDPRIHIIARYDSVEELVTFFKKNTVDLIFLDIQLADGKSFELFEKVDVAVPIIFTTAYDQYALQAFKHYSIDYLLKPIQPKELNFSLDKFKNLQVNKGLDTSQWNLLKELSKATTTSYKQRFLVRSGNKLLYKPVEDVAYFYADGKLAYLVTAKENRKYLIDNTLEQLEAMLEPKSFFRISRKFIINIEAVAEVKGSVSTKMEVFLHQKADFNLSVSRDKISDFKKWLDN